MAEGRLPKIAMKWMPKQKRTRGRPKKNWMEGIRKATNERKLNEGRWEDRKQWSLGVGQRRTTTFWNRHTYIHTYIHTYVKVSIIWESQTKRRMVITVWKINSAAYCERGAGIRYWPENQGTGVRFPAVSNVFPALHDFQPLSGAHRGFSSVGTTSSFPGSGYSGQDVKLTTLMMKLRISGGVSPQSYDVVTDTVITLLWTLMMILLNWCCRKMILFGFQQWRTEGGLGCSNPPPPKFRRPSKIVPNSTRLWKLLNIAEFRMPTPQHVRKKGSNILKLPSVRNCFTLAMTNKLVVIINSLIVQKSSGETWEKNTIGET